MKARKGQKAKAEAKAQVGTGAGGGLGLDLDLVGHCLHCLDLGGRERRRDLVVCVCLLRLLEVAQRLLQHVNAWWVSVGGWDGSALTSFGRARRQWPPPR